VTFGPEYPSDETFPAVRVAFFGPVVDGVEQYGARTFPAAETARAHRLAAGMEQRGYRVIVTDVG
jgi:hypothetical protein